VVRDPLSTNAFLFDGYNVAISMVRGLDQPSFLVHDTIAQCLQVCNDLTKQK
jgi:hypothetical protein